MFPIVFVNVAELDVGIEAAPEANEAIAEANGALWLGNENSNAGEALGKDKALYDLQEVLVVVDPRLKIRSENAQPALGNCRDFNGGCERVLFVRKNPTAALRALRFHTVRRVGAGHVPLYEGRAYLMCQLDHV